ncbi:hypothetical protein BT63DRAFT_454597 [Microthyrium microscopicum]|uniref:FAS1 domain-containing protein n=1 Tax=Microthyrium microscopicum TaxID=703497 RepID=A0A6A6UFJ3_9PEZI|nr:hypothetical protein BT63DRAFT_454597 [Microthyrium microscopicum]
MFSRLYTLLSLISVHIWIIHGGDAGSAVSAVTSVGGDQWAAPMTGESGASGGQTPANDAGTVFVPQTLSSKFKRDTEAGSSWVRRQLATNPSFLYQISPHVLPSALLRSFTGSVIPTYDYQDAILSGRGQVATTHGARESGGLCNATDPVKIYSGFGDVVTIIKADIPFDGGIIHIVSEPQTLSATLASTTNTSIFSSYISDAFMYLDNIPEITVFVPSDSAIKTALQCSQGNLDIARLLRAHIIVGFTAYSPVLVEGLQARAQDGSIIDVTTDVQGDIFINGAKVCVPPSLIIRP